MDGRAVVAVSGVVLAVDPGKRKFETRLDGRVLAGTEIEARAGDLPTVKLETKAPVSQPEKGVTAEVTPYPVRNPSPLAPALTPRGVAVGTAYAAGAVALVAGIAAGILEAQRVSLRAGLAPDACPTPDASTRCAELRQVFEMRTGARNVALVAAGVAVAAGGVTVVLHVTGERAKSAGVVMVSGHW